MAQTGDFRARYGPWGLVVGASAGIGAGFAEGLARRGVNVIALARRRPRLEDLAARLRAEHGVEVRVLAADVTDPALPDLVRDATADVEVGTLIHNASAHPTGPFLDVELAAHLESITVDCVVPTVLCHQLAPAMVARGRGAVVLVTSMGALQGGAVFASYFAAKAYDWILAEGLWVELGTAGVDALAYVVGATATEVYEDTSAGIDRRGRADGGEVETGDVYTTALNRVRNPAPPDEVAARLFDVLGDGPTAFSHPVDERTAARVLRLGRAEAVGHMSRLTAGNWG